MRSTSGIAADSTGGDFRFQGQWLESVTGLYNFRARDYDSRTGTFLSRDPVEPIEQQPEALNPYQAMHNNPYVYSDPSGQVTLIEINAGRVVEDILRSIQKAAIGQTKDFVKDKAGELITDLILGTLNTYIPFPTSLSKAFGTGNRGLAGIEFGKFVQSALCTIFSGSSAFDSVWIAPTLNITGKPENNGFTCRQYEGQNEIILKRPKGTTGRPDFLFKKGQPVDLETKGYLVGDIKLSTYTLVNAYTGKNAYKREQWQALTNYARRHQYVPITAFFTFQAAKGEQLQQQIKVLQKEAAARGVLAYIASK